MYLYLVTFYLYFIIFCCTYNYIKKVHSWWLMLHLFSKPSWWSTLYDTIKYNSSQFCLRPLNCYRNCICKPKYLRQVCNENLLSQFKMLIKNNEWQCRLYYRYSPKLRRARRNIWLCSRTRICWSRKHCLTDSFCWSFLLRWFTVICSFDHEI